MSTKPLDTTVDTRDMVEMHRVFRRELRLAPALVRATADGDMRRAKTVSRHVALLTLLVESHHANQDGLLWPALLEHVPEHLGPVVGLMETQHRQIHDLMQAVTDLIPAWTESAAAPERDRLGDALDRLYPVLVEHLDTEENQIPPLVAGHLPAADYRQIGAKAVLGLPQARLALIYGMLKYEGDPGGVAAILACAPPPARVLLPILGPLIHRRYVKRVHGTTTP